MVNEPIQQVTGDEKDDSSGDKTGSCDDFPSSCDDMSSSCDDLLSFNSVPLVNEPNERDAEKDPVEEPPPKKSKISSSAPSRFKVK